MEFVEGEPTKFLLITGDSRLHLKASSLDEKQHWVKYLRSIILVLNPLAKMDRSQSLQVSRGFLEPEISHDLEPSPRTSPYLKRKEFLLQNGSPASKSLGAEEGSPGSPQGNKFGEFDKVIA